MHQLPPRSDIMAATDLCAAIKSDDTSSGVAVSCEGMSVFSAAMAQLLVCLGKTLESIGQRLTLTSVPDKMKNEMAHLGLSEHMRHWEEHA